MKKVHLHFAGVSKFIVLAIFLFVSCSGSNSQTVNGQQGDSLAVLKKDNRKKPPSSYNDTISIYARAALFYLPDSLQLIKIKRANEKMIFESLMHDCFYQMRNARLLIQRDWQTIQIIDISKNRFINFIRTDGRNRVIDLDAVNDICGIYLFDPAREPERIDMMNIDTELGFYFKK